jgi:hypothetical protein
MIPYTEDEMKWVSQPRNKRRSNQTADGQPPQEQDDRLWQRCWGIKTTIEVDGRTYVVPVQL